jgi:hypothetical protein
LGVGGWDVSKLDAGVICARLHLLHFPVHDIARMAFTVASTPRCVSRTFQRASIPIGTIPTAVVQDAGNVGCELGNFGTVRFFSGRLDCCLLAGDLEEVCFTARQEGGVPRWRALRWGMAGEVARLTVGVYWGPLLVLLDASLEHDDVEGAMPLIQLLKSRLGAARVIPPRHCLGSRGV